MLLEFLGYFFSLVISCLFIDMYGNYLDNKFGFFKEPTVFIEVIAFMVVTFGFMAGVFFFIGFYTIFCAVTHILT